MIGVPQEFTNLFCCLPCTDLETSLQPRGIENSALEVPLGGSRQINFTVSFVNEGIDYRPALFVDGTYLIDNNNFVNDGYLQIVRRGCNNSDRPGVTCRLLQLTVNGRVGFRDLNGSSLQFAVRGSDVLDISCSTSTITIKIIGKCMCVVVLNNVLLHYYN